MLQRRFKTAIHRYWAITTCIVLHTLPQAVTAQQPTTIEEAGNHIEVAQLFFSQERYLEAAAEFEAAYRVVPYPEFLYNIGVCYERAESLDAAIDAYERFITRTDNEAEVSEVQAKLRELRATQNHTNTARHLDLSLHQIDTLSEGMSSDTETPSWPTWTLLGSGSVFTALGVTLLALGEVARATVENAAPGTSWAEVSAAHDQSHWMPVAGWTTLVLGLTAAGVGLSFLLLESEETEGSQTDEIQAATGAALRLRIGVTQLEIAGTF